MTGEYVRVTGLGSYALLFVFFFFFFFQFGPHKLAKGSLFCILPLLVGTFQHLVPPEFRDFRNKVNFHVAHNIMTCLLKRLCDDHGTREKARLHECSVTSGHC